MSFHRLLFRMTVSVGLVAMLRANGGEQAKKPEPSAEVSYYRDIRRIFQQHCQGCHQPAKAQGGYVMTNYGALLEKSNSDERGIVPGKPQMSLLIRQISAQGGKRSAMPKGRDPLSERDVNLITKWIAQGARDDTPASAREVVDQRHPPVYV